MLNDLWYRLHAMLSGGRNDEGEDDDPEILLSRAQRAMEERHVRNRERVIQVITQKNNLQQMVDDQQKRVDNLQARAELALKRGDDEEARRIRLQVMRHEISLAETKVMREQAVEIAEQCRALNRREEARIGVRTAEIRALKAEWQMLQIQDPLYSALLQMRSQEETGLLTERELLERHTRNREHAVEAITHKNYLIVLAEDTEKGVANLRARAEIAARRGEAELSQGLIYEAEHHEAMLARMRPSLERAIALAEQIKALIRQNEALVARYYADRQAAEKPGSDPASAPITEPKAAPGFLLFLLILAFIAALTVLLLLLWSATGYLVKGTA